MRSFQQSLPEFAKRGLQVVALSVDSPEVSKAHRAKLGLTFPFLSATPEVLQRYDLLHKAGGPGGADIATPAEILVDSTGVVRWLNLTRSATVRVRPEAVLAAWDATQK